MAGFTPKIRARLKVKIMSSELVGSSPMVDRGRVSGPAAALQPQAVSAVQTTERAEQKKPESSQQALLREEEAREEELQAKEPSREAVSDAVKNLNDYVQNVRRDLQFSMDNDSGRTVIKVMDSETGTMIRQIPSDEILEMAEFVRGMQADNNESDGLFVNAKA